MKPNNWSKYILWVIGFIGLGGLLFLWGVISKPFLNFSLDTVDYKTDTYSHIILQNSSRSLNRHIQVKVSFPKETKEELDFDLFNSGSYTLDTKGITINLGKNESFGFTCINCQIKDTSIEKISPADYSLRDCRNRGSDCLYEDKISMLLKILLYVLPIGWLFGALTIGKKKPV